MFHPSLDPASVAARRKALLDDGYLVLPEFLDDDGVAVLIAEIDTLINEHDPGRGYLMLRDANGFPVAMNRMDRVSDLLFDLAREPALIDVASVLLDKPAISLHTEYFAKAATQGPAVPAHQDHAFYEAHFAEELAVSLWVALDEVTEDGSALEYATKSPFHLLPHRPSPAPDFDYELADPAGLEFRPVAVRRGGCIAFHSFAIHRVSPNRSGRPRRALVFNYRGSPYRQWLATTG